MLSNFQKTKKFVLKDESPQETEDMPDIHYGKFVLSLSNVFLTIEILTQRS